MYEEYLKHINTEITEDIKKFVDDEVFRTKEYLFYKSSNNSQVAYCTKHHGEFDTIGLHHNEDVICPVCGSVVTAKSLRYGRKNCFNQACFYYFQKSAVDPAVITCKGYYVTRHYADYKNPVTNYSLQAVYIFENKKSTMLKKAWRELEVKKSIFDFNQGWLSPMMCYCSFDSIGEAIKDTPYQYIPYEMFAGHYSMVKLFSEYSKYPWIEQLCKIGFSSIIEAKLQGNYLYSCLNYRGKDIFKKLKLSRKDVKDIRGSGIEVTPLFLNLYQTQAKDNSRLAPGEVKKIEKYYCYDYSKLNNILEYMSLRKAVNYIDKQCTKYSKNFYGKNNVVTALSDYIDDCIKLEMDLTCENVLFPKDLYSAHQNTISQIQIKANELLNKQILKRIESLEKYKFEYNGLIIRAAESSNELIAEGKTLHHCVGTYAQKYAEGKTNILFIRKLSNPDKPYFTLELKDNKIVQVHGLNNRSPKKDVGDFIEAWTNAKLKKKTRIKIATNIAV